MATLKVIRKRIGSVKNTQKITKAMKMVSAAKLRRAQNALMQSRPYAAHLSRVLRRLALRIEPGSTPYLASEDTSGTALVFVITSDRGLCGGFNSNLLRRVHYSLRESIPYEKIDFMVLGRKGRDFFKAKKIPLRQEASAWAEGMLLARARDMAAKVSQAFEAGEFGAFYLVYNAFQSAISQEIRIRRILPVEAATGEVDAQAEAIYPVIYEPSAPELFKALIPRYVTGEIFLALSESLTAELAARMSAMENATNNAKEMIGMLTLQYNRARQASITRELMDIVNGAEALK